MIDFYIKTNWNEVIKKISFQYIPFLNFILNEYKYKEIFPKIELIFNCFNFFDKEKLKVVILGQDPYHNVGQAMGISFSVPINTKIPSSLKNMFKELENDLNIKRTNPDLSDWAYQGVLLLNTCLTVEKNKPLSHSNLGWELLINDIIKYINFNFPNTIFIFMGNNAKKFSKIISKKEMIIMSTHPSGLSAHKGFFGSKIFSKTNEMLIKMNKEEIKW